MGAIRSSEYRPRVLLNILQNTGCIHNKDLCKMSMALELRNPALILSGDSHQSSRIPSHACANHCSQKGTLCRLWSSSLKSSLLSYTPCVGLHAQLCPILCNPVDCSPPGSSVHRIFQARILEWVTISSSKGSSRHRDRTCDSCVSCITGGFFTTELPGKSIHYNCLILPR